MEFAGIASLSLEIVNHVCRLNLENQLENVLNAMKDLVWSTVFVHRNLDVKTWLSIAMFVWVILMDGFVMNVKKVMWKVKMEFAVDAGT